MPTSLTASTRALRVTLDPSTPTPDTVDIYFDDHRVWSTAMSRVGNRASVTWPVVLRAKLAGEAQIRVVDSSTGTTVAEGHASFPGSGRVSITDSRGRWLAMNKWDRLGPTMEGDQSGVQARLLASASELIRHLEAWGYPVYLVGGTLLGAMRTGEMMAHDDDIDIAWLCEAETLADVALASYEMERRLTAIGLTALRLGQAHLQITYFSEDGFIDHYVDIFTGFWDDGLYNQPFALRGGLDRSDLVPVRRIELNGIEFPAPALPERWLVYAYGPSWAVPDPSFKFPVVPATKRLFESTFGVYNRQRVWWEKHYEQLTERPESTEGNHETDRFLQLLPAGSRVIDFGCGDGRLTDRLAAAGHHVTGYDYSYEGLRLARQGQTTDRRPGVEFEHLNANNRRDVLRVALDHAASGQDVWVFAHDLLHCMPANGRESLYLMLRAVLNDRTRAYLTFCSDPHPQRSAENPNTWSLRVSTLYASLRSFGLSMVLLESRQVETPWGERTRREVLVWR